MRRKKNRKFKTKNRRVVRNQKIRARRCFRTKNNSKCHKTIKSYKQRKKSMLYTLHWLIGESEETPLGNFINAINEKVDDLSELLEESYSKMQEDYQEKRHKIYEYYKPYRKQLEIEENKLLKSGYEEEEAYNVSNLKALDESEERELHELFDRDKTFSDLFFRSILISLYSIVESELIQVIDNNSLPLSFQYSNEGKLNFLKKIIVENGINDISYFDELISLSVARNAVAHNKMVIKLNPKKETYNNLAIPILQANKNCELTQKGDRYTLSISNIDFIKGFIKSTRILFNQVNWAIDKDNNYELLKSRLLFLLSISDIEVIIDSINVNYQLKETSVDFEGQLPTHNRIKYQGTLFISNKLEQDAKSMISFTNNIFDSLKSSDAIDFLYNTTLKGFLCKELKQKVLLKLNI